MAQKLALVFLFTFLASSVGLSQAQTRFGLGTLGTEDGGSCGFMGGFPANGTFVTGFSEAIYGSGAVCGGCFLVQCRSGAKCKNGGRVVVTATNECMAQNATSPCTKPRAALNLQPVAFDQIATSRAPGIVNINYIPMPCIRVGGIQFMVTTGNKYYLSVLIQNVAGPGSLTAVFIKAGALRWTAMTRSYGSVWQVSNYDITGKALSFLTLGYNGQRLFVPNALPSN